MRLDIVIQRTCRNSVVVLVLRALWMPSAANPQDVCLTVDKLTRLRLAVVEKSYPNELMMSVKRLGRGSDSLA